MMRKSPSQKKSLFILIAIFIFTLGSPAFSLSSIPEIETAILKGDYNLSQKLAKDLLDKNQSGSESQQAAYYLGLSHLKLKQYPPALEVFDRLIKDSHDKPLQFKAYLGKIDAYYLLGQYEEALSTAKKLLKKKYRPDALSLVYLRLARSSLKMAQWYQAQEYLQKIITEFPESLEAGSARQLLEEKQFFALQLGAFRDRERAERLIFELGQKNYYAYIVETKDKDGVKFYRVRLGQYAALEEAYQMQLELTKLGYPAEIYP